MSRIALVGPNSALGAQVKPALETAGLQSEDIEFFAPSEAGAEHGMTKYDGAAEWVKSVMSESLQKARMIVLCEALPAGVSLPTAALVLDLPASLHGAKLPILDLKGAFAPGLWRLATPAAALLAELQGATLTAQLSECGPIIAWHLSSATEELPGGAFELMDEATKMLNGSDVLDADVTHAFNLRLPADPGRDAWRTELASLGADADAIVCRRIAAGQFHCGLLLVDLPTAGAGYAPPGRWRQSQFTSVQAAAGLDAPLVRLEPAGTGIRLEIAYDPFTAALFPAVLKAIEHFTADA